MKKTLGIPLGLLASLCLLAFVAAHLYLDALLREALLRAGVANVAFESAALDGYRGIKLQNVTIKGETEIKIAAVTLSHDKHLRVFGLDAAFGEIGVEGVEADLLMESFSPPAFTHQAVTVKTLAAALPLTDGVLDVSMDAGGKITVHKSGWKLAGGTLSSSPFSINLADLSTQLILTAENLDLQKLFQISPIDGLSLTGRVNGTIPVVIEGERAAIVHGKLETTKGGGTISYTPKELPAFLQGDGNKQISDLRAALAAFEYESLKLTLNGEAGKRQKISLQARGKNASFYEGRPIVINFNVEGPLESVIRHTPTGR